MQIVSRGSARIGLGVAALALGACGGGPDAGPDADLVGLDAGLVDASTTTETDAADANDTCGMPCGECSAGTVVCEGHTVTCEYPGRDFDPDLGLPPADTGDRAVFFAEDFGGTPEQRIEAAGAAAAEVGGAVVLNKIYETERPVRFYDGILYTGGGLRRGCTPVGVVTTAALETDSCVTVDRVDVFSLGSPLQAVLHDGYDGRVGSFSLASVDAEGSRLCSRAPLGFAIPVGAKIIRVHNLARTGDTYSAGIVIDSMVFDGAERCNSETHDWRYNNTLPIRGPNEISNSIFVDIPSENLTTCGARLTGNVAVDLEGSLIHKSCGIVPPPADVLVGNYVESANQSGDQLMQHSEGLITFSANAGNIVSVGNVYRHGGEGVYGLAGPDDQNVSAVSDCYAHFPRLIRLYNDADPSTFVFEDVELIDVGSSHSNAPSAETPSP